MKTIGSAGFPSCWTADPAGEELEVRVVAAPAIEQRIFVIRERQVMLDEDLANLYGVETKRLVRQVKRNPKRFPADFMFQLTTAEAQASRSQIATSNEHRGDEKPTVEWGWGAIRQAGNFDCRLTR